MNETELFLPVCNWLIKKGYAVHAEVKHCDVAAYNDDGIIVVELKRAFTIDLLLQAIERQTLDASVYVAIPARPMEIKRLQMITKLLNRLQVGLLIVDMKSNPPRVTHSFSPTPETRRRSSSKTSALLQEISRRSLNLNVGGSTRKPIMTAYREQVLTVAVGLARLGATSARRLCKIGAPKNTWNILRGNYYGWFVNPAKGIYDLTDLGKKALQDYSELVEVIEGRLNNTE